MNTMRCLHRIAWALIITVLLVSFLTQPAWAQEDPLKQADALAGEGIKLFDAGDYPKALDQFNQALPLYRQAQSLPGENGILFYRGLTLEQLQKYDQALADLQACLPYWQETGEALLELLTSNAISRIYRQQGQYDLALEPAKAVLALARQLGNKDWEKTALNSLVAISIGLEDVPQRIAWYQELTAYYEIAGDLPGQIETLYNIGLSYSSIDQYAQAANYYQQSANLASSTGDQPAQLKAWLDLAITLQIMGQYPEALALHLKAIDTAKALGDRGAETDHLTGAGVASVRLADYFNAIRYYSAALELAKETGDQRMQGTLLNNLGLVYHYYLLDLDTAAGYYNQAAEAAIAIQDIGLTGLVFTNMGTLFLDWDDPEEALAFYEKALEQIQSTSTQHGLGSVLSDIGLAYKAIGQVDKALDYFEQASAAYQAVLDRRNAAANLINIAWAYYEQKDYPTARQFAQQALDETTTIADSATQADAYNTLAHIYKEMGEIDKAIDAYKKAIAINETILAGLKVEEIKTAFASTQSGMYENLVALLWQQGRYADALNYSERGRARTFLDQLASGVVDLRAGAPEDLLKQERRLRVEIDAQRGLLRNFRSQSSQRDLAAETQTQLNDLLEQYDQVLAQIKVRSPETIALVSVEVTSLDEIQTNLAPEVTLVEYQVTPETAFAYIITAENFDTVILPVKESELESTIAEFRSFASLDDPYPESLQRLYAWLIEPILPYLKTPVVGIIPHRVLHYLPFAALTDGKAYFGENYALFTLPSASVLSYLHTKNDLRSISLLAFGNPAIIDPLPDLQYAEREAQQVASYLKVQPYLKQQATETSLLNEASQANIIHLAAHGVYNKNNPLFSAVLLAKDSVNDGRLETFEIYHLDLRQNTDLVVLSACQTQLGELTSGEELIGLTRAFLYSGAPSVISSLWSVDDAATGLLMERFYTHLMQGNSKARALRLAQADVRKKYKHPYFWAAFTLNGDPGRGMQYSDGKLRLNSRNVGIAALMAWLAGAGALFTAVVLAVITVFKRRTHARIT